MTEEEGLERNATWLALKMEQVDHEPRNMGSLLKMEKEKKKQKKNVAMEHSPANAFLASESLCWTSDLQNCKVRNLCCFKAYSLW